MTGDSESEPGRPGLLASLGRLFGGGRRHGPTEPSIEDDRPGDTEVASRAAAAGEPSPERPGDAAGPAEEPGEEDGDEDELVLGPSLKAAPEAEPAAEPDESGDGPAPDIGTPAPAEDIGPEEEAILARLRAVRAQQDAGEAAAGQQWAARSEDAWTAAHTADEHTADETEPARAEEPETGSAWLTGGRLADGEGETSSAREPDSWGLAEGSGTGYDDERQSADEDAAGGAATAPDALAGAVPLFPRPEPDEADEASGGRPVDEDGTGTQAADVWTPEETEPQARGDEPAAPEASGAEAHELGMAEPDMTGAPAEAEAAEPEDAMAKAAEAPEAGPGAEEGEATPPVPGEVEAEDFAPPEPAQPEDERDEEAAAAGVDEAAAAGAAVAAAAGATSSGASEPRAEQALDEAELEEIVRRLIRLELEGELGQRLSANIRRMIREEVSHALLRNR